MKKIEFKKLMKELVSIKQAENVLSKAFKEFEPEFNCISFGRYETLVVRSLEFAMNDKYQWISYWIYDCEFGTKTIGKITDKNGKNIPIKTLDQLYVIINNKDF